MITLVGSRALHAQGYPFRAAKDWDYLADKPWDLTKFGLYETDLFWDSRLAALDWGRVATLDQLYTLKVSHMFWEINRSSVTWNKHAYDCIALSRMGAKFNRAEYDILKPIWKERHGRREVNLRQTKDQFFSDNVVRHYDHDSLHESVCYQPALGPAYTWVLKPGSEVDCDYALFEELPHDYKIQLCREEIYVTALERLLIPSNYQYPARRAYHWALRRTITSLFKNDWALWMVLNLDELLVPDVDYRALHKQRAHLLIPMEATSG